MIRFEEFELEENERELRRVGAPVSVEPKTLDLLLYLIERRHRMVGKEELFDALWPDTHVTDASLTSCISRLRHALADRGALVKTYHRRGYRFVGELVGERRERADEPDAAAGQAARAAGRPGRPPFAGRRQELLALVDGLGAARAGRGVLALVSGEQGIGKTRLVDELLAQHADRDALALVGHCVEGDATPPFWPWVEPLRACSDRLESEELRALVQAGEDDIVHLVPELATSLPSTPTAPAPLDSAEARYRLFHQVTSFFRRLSKRRPVILVIEDLHWADRASLLLLRYLARELADMAMLVLATYRSEEPTEALREALPVLHSAPGVRALALRGLSQSESIDLVRALTGRAVPASIGERICGETDGNPFFVEHLARHLIERGWLGGDADEAHELDVPEGVRTVIQRRLDRLSRDCRQTLSIAAVIGRDFELGLLNAVRAEARGQSPAGAIESTLATLEEATRARILEAPASASGRYRFAHAMLRETIYRSLGSAERSRRHRRVAEEIERATAGDERWLPELADHFVRGAASGAIEQAFRYAVSAGRQANSRFAFEIAAQRFAQALEMRRLVDRDHSPEAIALRIAIAEAHWNAGERAKSRSSAELAAELARKAGEAQLFAQAVLASELTSAQRPAPVGWISSSVDERHVQLVEEALAGLPESDSGLRARLLARLGWAFYFHPDRGERRDRLTREAVEMARRLGDVGTLFGTLTERHHALMAPDHAAERLHLANEMIRLAETEGSRPGLAIAYGLRAWDAAESGAMRAADADMAICGQLATETHQPVLRCRYLLWQGMRAMLEGRWDDAARLAQEAYTLGKGVDEDLATINLANQLLTMQVMIGRIDGIADNLHRGIEQYPSLSGLRAALAHVEMLRGDSAAAREAAERCLARGVAGLPWDATSLITLGLLSLVYARLEDGERCAELYAALLPYAEQNVMLGVNAIACFGPTARALGNLAAALGRCEEADRHFRHAINAQRLMNARPWLAYTCVEHAHWLSRRGAGDQRDLVAQRRGEARELAVQLDLPLVLRESDALP